jgi:hypothetical protein
LPGDDDNDDVSFFSSIIDVVDIFFVIFFEAAKIEGAKASIPSFPFTTKSKGDNK